MYHRFPAGDAREVGAEYADRPPDRPVIRFVPRRLLLALIALPLLLLAACAGNPLDPTGPGPSGPGPMLGCSADPVGATYYVDGANGDDANPGTEALPWKTPEHALDSISGGDAVVFRGGIYRVDGELRFDVSGLGPDAKTIYRAMPGERVIFTRSDDLAPAVVVKGDYIRLEGLWFGGSDWEGSPNEFFASGGGRMDSGHEFVGNTFFGYRTVRGGALEHSFWQGNRFVRVGMGNDPPMLFLSGYHSSIDAYSQHAVVDRNLFVSGKGYAINGWHSWRNFIVTRNVIADVWGGFIGDGNGSEGQGPRGEGSDHLVANNLIWRASEFDFNGATLIADRTHFLNNVVAFSRLGLPGDWPAIEDLRIDRNAFYSTQTFRQTPGGSSLELTDPAAELGISVAAIDQAVAELKRAFAQPVRDIFQDSTIERNFAALAGITVPAGSPLQGAGEAWDGSGSIDIGPGVAFEPSCPSDFWAAFEARGLIQWKKDGTRQ